MIFTFFSPASYLRSHGRTQVRYIPAALAWVRWDSDFRPHPLGNIGQFLEALTSFPRSRASCDTTRVRCGKKAAGCPPDGRQQNQSFSYQGGCPEKTRLMYVRGERGDVRPRGRVSENGSYFEHHAMLPQRKTLMATLQKPPGPSVVLENVSWQTYENLLADLVDSSAPRLTYDRGVLEIMSPSAEHERLNRTLALLVEILAEELSIETENLGSATFRREDLERGFEPDSCFYVRNADRIRGKRHLDLGVDPPPDLVIEIDITSSSIDKMPIYAQIGVPELWRYDGTTLEIASLEGKAYVTSSSSAVFPVLTAATLSDYLAQSRHSTRLELIKAFREWIRSQ